jgi:hypothetical protein
MPTKTIRKRPKEKPTKISRYSIWLGPRTYNIEQQVSAYISSITMLYNRNIIKIFKFLRAMQSPRTSQW